MDSKGSLPFLLDELHNEDGSPLSDEQKASYKQAIETNGLFGFDKSGKIIQVCQPQPIH